MNRRLGVLLSIWLLAMGCRPTAAQPQAGGPPQA